MEMISSKELLLKCKLIMESILTKFFLFLVHIFVLKFSVYVLQYSLISVMFILVHIECFMYVHGQDAHSME